MKKALLRNMLISMPMVAASSYVSANLLTSPVQISGNKAFGSLQATRNTWDEGSYIGCRIGTTFIPNPSNLTFSTNGACSAHTADGNDLGCTFQNPSEKTLIALSGLTDTSYLEFTKDPDTGKCVDIKIINGSDTF